MLSRKTVILIFILVVLVGVFAVQKYIVQESKIKQSKLAEIIEELNKPEKFIPVDFEAEWKKQATAHLGEDHVLVAGKGTLSPPFSIGDEQVLVEENNVYLHGWISERFFTFTIYDAAMCDSFQCYGTLYQYDVLKKNYVPIENHSDSYLTSPDGRYTIIFESGVVENPSESLGVFSIKDNKSSKIRTLGRAISKTGHNNAYTGTHFQGFSWSPDSTKIAFLDWNSKQFSYPNICVAVLSIEATDLSERKCIGSTTYKETEREPNEQLIFWSPDSAMLYAKDSFSVLDVKNSSTIYKFEADGRLYLRSWSPWSDKILGAYYPFGFFVLNVHTKTKHGYLLPESHDDLTNNKRLSDNIKWAPKAPYLIAGLLNTLYFINTETGEFGLIGSAKPEYFKSLHWSPDGNKLLYFRAGKIIIREVAWY